MLAILIGPFGHCSLIADGEVAFCIIVGNGCSVAEVDGLSLCCLGGLAGRWQAEFQGQGQWQYVHTSRHLFGMSGVLLAAIPGNLGDDDVAVLDLAPYDFVNVVHLASPIRHIFSSSRVDFPCVAGCGACPP